MHTSDIQCFLKTIRSPFPFPMLLRISFHSDIDCNLLLKGWPQKGKGKKKILPFYFSTQSSSLFSHLNRFQEGRRENHHCFSSVTLARLRCYCAHPKSLILYAILRAPASHMSSTCKSSHIIFIGICASS